MMCKKMLLVVVTVSVLTISSAQAQSLTGYWPLDNNLNDSSGNSSAASIFGGTEQYSATVPAAIGGAASFDFDGVTLVDLPFMNFYGNAHSTGATLSMWVNGGAQGDKRIFAEACNTGGGGCNTFYGVGTDNTGAMDNLRRFVRSDNGAFTHDARAATTAFDSSWHHVVLTDNGGTTNVYVDGVLDAASTSFNYSPTAPLTSDNTTIGGFNIGGGAGNQFTGLIDDVAIWDRELPTSSITALAGGASPPNVAVPEPGSGLLTLISAVGMLYLRRRNR